MPDLTAEMERELAELEAALRPAVQESRPAADPAWAHRMDKLVERGFEGWSPPTRTSGRRWWRPALTAPAFGAALAAALVALVLVVPKDRDEAGGGGDSAGSGGAASAPAAPEDSARESLAAQPEAGAARAGDEGGGAAAEEDGGGDAAVAAPDVAPVPPRGPGSPRSDGKRARAVERSSSLTLATRPRDLDSVARRIQEVTRAHGGFVLSSAVDATRTGGTGQFTLRVPARNLDAAMARLAALGTVRNRADRSEDITAVTVSARSRLRESRTERESLLRQLAAADTPQETEAIRVRLDIVAREIAGAREDVRRLANRAAYATVAVTLVTETSGLGAGEDDEGGWSPADAADDALRVLEVAAGVALVALALLVPLALLAALALVAARWGSRRRRERALDAV